MKHHTEVSASQTIERLVGIRLFYVQILSPKMKRGRAEHLSSRSWFPPPGVDSDENSPGLPLAALPVVCTLKEDPK